MLPSSFPPLPRDVFDDDDDDDGWQDMPIVREDTSLSGMDEEDLKKYHYQPSASMKSRTTGNATGNLIDVDDMGNEWRSKLDRDESEYTRLRVNEVDDNDEVHLRTKYLFDEDKAMTPLSQMQATKNLLTEAQRIAYVGLCALTSREMVQNLQLMKRKELKVAITNMELWALKIMGRLYYHMELETQEQKMIESLANHGVLASDLIPALMTTHTVANPEYDPEEARKKAESSQFNLPDTITEDDEESISDQTLVNEPISRSEPGDLTNTVSTDTPSDAHRTTSTEIATTNSANETTTISIRQVPTTTKLLKDSLTAPMPGVSTSLSSADENVTLDIRWTILCDLFLILIADSVYDARSRVLLEQVACKLGLGWLDVVKFESRITEALEIQEDVETLENQGIIQVAQKAGKKRRYMMLGLATLGGGLVIGLSAGLLAPVIGLGLAGALTTVGVTGTGAFLGGTAGAAVITTGGVLTGSGIAVRGMVKRTQQVRTFDILPLHNNKRVSCVLTVPGFMSGLNDDVRLPFSVLDPIVGDVFSVLWEPEMIKETGAALKILTGEVLSQIGMTVLQATVMTGLMSALQWPIILTKLGYLIDNPWSNALDRARSAGRVLADVLINRHLGVRPITLIGFSLGARVIFYALLELAKQKQFGIVQDVFLMGATLTVSQNIWHETRSVVSGRYVNAFAKNDWVLNYLFRATSGGVGAVAGLRPIEGVPGLENVDVTDKIAGHMSYRTFMPLILDQLGFPVVADYFDEPEEPDFTEERIVVREGEKKKKSGWFSRKKAETTPQKPVSRPPSAATFAITKKPVKEEISGLPDDQTPVAEDNDELPPRMESAHASVNPETTSVPSSGRCTPIPSRPSSPSQQSQSLASSLPIHAGFDLNAIKGVLKEAEPESVDKNKPSVLDVAASPQSNSAPSPAKKSFFSRLAPVPIATHRSHSTPPSQVLETSARHRSTSLDESQGQITLSSVDLEDRGPKTANFLSPKDENFNTLPSHAKSVSAFTKSEVKDSSISLGLGANSNMNNRAPFLSSLSPEVVPSWGASTLSFNNFESPTTAKPSMSTFSLSPSSSNPSVFVNPFASPDHDRTPVMSFGAVGEEMDVSSFVASKNHTWEMPKLSTEKSTTLDPGLNTNPWS